MFRISLIIIFISLFLSGCISVNLKSSLPKVSYFSLDSVELNEELCKKAHFKYNVNINVLSPYDNKDILAYTNPSNRGRGHSVESSEIKWRGLNKNSPNKTQSLSNELYEIKILESYRWIDLPKNMIRNALIKLGANNCVSIESSLNTGLKSLKLNINDLHVLQDGDTYSAFIYIDYEVLDAKNLKDKIVIIVQNDNPIKALQDATLKALGNIIFSIAGH